MEIEKEKDEHVVDEYELIYVNNVSPLNVVQYPLRPNHVPFENYFKLKEVTMKPIQKNIEFKYQATKNISNFNSEDRGDNN